MDNLHTLTALTGRDAGANRTIIIKGFEARRRTVVVLAIGAVPALFTAVILWSFIGQYAILALPAVEGATYFLIETRSRTGMQRRTYETLLDRKRSDAGQFTMCGRVINPDLHELGTVVKASVPSPWSTGADRAAPLPVPAPPGPVSTTASGMTFGVQQ